MAYRCPDEKFLKCRECGREFLFGPDEQKFYKRQGFGAPSRCRDCRRAEAFRQRGLKVYRGVCAACGKTARVAFPPAGSDLIYCGDCWAQMQAERKELRRAGVKKK